MPAFLMDAASIRPEAEPRRHGDTARQQTGYRRVAVSQSTRQRRGLLRREVVQLDAPADVERRQPYFDQSPKHPCFLKPPDFREEAEVRAVWLASGGVIKPVVLELPCLKQYLSLISDAKSP